MTKARKLSIAGVLLVLVAVAVVITGRRGGQPRLAVTFLRYEDGGDTAVLQVTNLGGARVLYSCFSMLTASSPNPTVASWAASVTGVVKARQEEEAHVKFVAGQRPSKIRIHYLPMDFRYRLKRRLGMDQESFEVLVELPRPPPKSSARPAP